MSGQAIKVFAPATVSNVGCGYDILGFAIDGPGDEIIGELTDSAGVQITEIHGDDRQLPRNAEKNTAGVSAKKLLEHLGEERGVKMRIFKKMPIGSGLGSSAASAVAGVYLVNTLLNNPLEKRELLPFAMAGEHVADGAWHADNVAPSLIGGMCLIRDNETLDVHRLPTPRGLYAVVIHPHITINTRDSRAVLSNQVTLEKCIKQSGNLGGLITGFFQSDIDLIQRSLQDVMIEPQRSHLVPGFYEVKNAALEAGVLGCSLSGAGPSVFALCMNTLIAENAAESMQKAFLTAGVKSTKYISPINQEGALLL